MYFSRNLITFDAFVLLNVLADGNFEKRSTHVRMYWSFPLSFVTGPQKSSWISSFGSLSKASGADLFLGDMAFRFLPI